MITHKYENHVNIFNMNILSMKTFDCDFPVKMFCAILSVFLYYVISHLFKSNDILKDQTAGSLLLIFKHLW